MNLLKNFLAVCRRYKTAMLLNLLGLTVAFAAFLIIMMQVNYETGFDRHYLYADRIYRMAYGIESGKPTLSRAWGEQLILSSPDIERAGALCYNPEGNSFYLPEKGRVASIQIEASKISKELLDVFEFDIVAGSVDRFDDPNTMILSQSAARQLFGEADPVGRTVVNGIDRPMEVIAVFRDFPKNSTLENGVYIHVGDLFMDTPQNFGSLYYLRIRSAESKEQVESDLTRKLREITQHEDIRIWLTNLHDVYYSSGRTVGSEKRGNRAITLSLLSVAVLIVVIAIINFLNFSMALIPIRIRSINTRKVFGCRTGRLRLNLLAEGILLAFVSFCLSLLIVQALSPTPLARALDSGINLAGNTGLVWFTLGVSLLSGLAAGLYPAYYITSFNPVLALKSSFGYSGAGKRLRIALISFQYVVAIALIAIALGIHSQNSFLREYDMGFSRENILTAFLPSPVSRSPDILREKLLEHPDIMDVTLTNGPFVAVGRMSWGREYKNESVNFTCHPVASNFLQFMGLKVVEGRDFLESDEQKANGTYIFNQTAQHSFHIEVGDRMGGHMVEPADIVGVVQDFNFRPLQYPISPIALYVFGSKPWNHLPYLMVRVINPNIRPAIEHIQHTIRSLDPDGAIPDVTFMDENLGNLYKKETNLSTLLTAASLLSVLISIIGIFGLILFETQYRRKEIGLRKVYGATVRGILLMFNRSYVRIVVVCFVVATPLAYVIVNRWLENFAYRMPVGWWIFAIALLIVLAVTVVTITMQSYRTATENPVRSIKTE